MRPTEAQHRDAFAGHKSRLDRWLGKELSNDSWRPVRLSYGLYFQLEHTSHMQRIKLPGGFLTAGQMDVMAEITDLYGRGISHVTTRADIQIHWVPVEQIIDMYERLHAVGISTRGACADSVRNVTACPFAGVAPSEPFDISPYMLAIHDYFLFNPMNLTLPRKFKIAVEGCEHDCAQCPVNDIGAYAKIQNGRRGFSLWAGGGLGAQPYLAKPLVDFIPAEDLLIWCEAIVRVQHRHGERKNRMRARMKYVVQRMKLEGFKKVCEEEVAKVTAEMGAALRTELAEAVDGWQAPPVATKLPAPVTAGPGFAHWKRTNARPQRQAGFFSAVVQLPLGDFTSHQMRALSQLSRELGNATLRCTNDQNIVLPQIPEAQLPNLFAQLVELELANPDAGTINDVVSCPGMDYCSLAITRSMGMAEGIRAHLLADPATGEGFAEKLGAFGIKISGCPNSCGQHHVGDLGLTGHLIADKSGVERPFYSILVGGSVGEGRSRVGKRLGRYPEEGTPKAIAALARTYEQERTPGERFPDWVDRVGMKRLAEIAAGAIG